MGKSTLYSQDFLQWTQEQIDSLRHGRWSELDIENLIEELEDLGRSEQRESGYPNKVPSHRCSTIPNPL